MLKITAATIYKLDLKTYKDNPFPTTLEKPDYERPEIAILEFGQERTHIMFNKQDKIITTMTEMSKEEIARFVMQGTFTGKLATLRKDGRSHVVPIWFVVDNENSKRRSRIGDNIFTTDSTSVKATNIQRNNKVSNCIDDQTRPFSFVTIFGSAKIHTYNQKEVLKWATKIADTWVGKMLKLTVEGIVAKVQFLYE